MTQQHLKRYKMKWDILLILCIVGYEVSSKYFDSMILQKFLNIFIKFNFKIFILGIFRKFK